MKATQEPRTDEAEAMADLLAGQDAAAVFDCVGALRDDDKGPAEVIGGVLLPAARSLHRRHRSGDIDAAALAAGLAVARRALTRAGDPAAPAPDASALGPVVVAAPANTGGLEAEAAYEALLATGHRAQLIAAVEDPEVLGRHLRTLAPLALVVASGDARSLPAVAALAATAGRAGVPVLASGPAFGSDGSRSARVGATAWVADPVEMLGVLGQWHRAGGALAMNVEEPSDAAIVRAAWPAVTMAAAGTGGPDEAWAQTTVRAVGEMLVASLWAEDVTVLLDWLDDELAGPDRTQVRDVHVVGLLDAVASALPASMAIASAMIGQARDHLRQCILRPGRPVRPAARTPVVADAPPAGGPNPPVSLVRPVTPLDTTAAAPTGAPPTAVQPGVALGALQPVPAGATTATAGGSSGAGPANAGQAFADLLLLGALGAQATGAALAVVQPGGRWSALAHGLEAREGLNDPLLWTAIAGRRDAVEISDLSSHPELSRSPLTQRPTSMRWAYGIALRDREGNVIAVFCLLDRWLRQVTRREQRALNAAARQLTVQLLQVRRIAAGAAAPAPAAPVWNAPRAPERLGARRNVALPEGQQLLRSHEVAVLFDVTERTVINWAAAGKLPSLRTIGGHLRFRSEDVYALLSARQAGA